MQISHFYDIGRVLVYGDLIMLNGFDDIQVCIPCKNLHA